MNKDAFRKSTIAGLGWFLLQLPSEISLWRCAMTSGALPFALAVLLLDAVIVGGLLYLVMLYRARRIWKCPACDGWGRRVFTPPAAEINEVMRALMETCAACKGRGVIWEIIGAVKLAREK